MALNPKTAVAQRNRAIDAVTARLNNGYLRIYSGSQPTDADTAIGAQVLLAELRFGATAFAAASGGSASANAITADTDANATGTAGWYRAFESDGTTVVQDGEVGTATANIVLNSTSIAEHAAVLCSAFSITMAA